LFLVLELFPVFKPSGNVHPKTRFKRKKVLIRTLHISSVLCAFLQVNERLHAGLLGCASYVVEIVGAVVGDYVFEIVSPMKEFSATVSVTGTDQVLDLGSNRIKSLQECHITRIGYWIS
jgi:hypothetical protein